MQAERTREFVKQLNEKERADARRAMCLEPEQLRDLLVYVDEQMFGLELPCDRSFRRTRAWAGLRDLNVERVLDSLRQFGGNCDCEVLLNVQPCLFGWGDREPEDSSKITRTDAAHEIQPPTQISE